MIYNNLFYYHIINSIKYRIIYYENKYKDFSREQLIDKILKLEKERYGLIWEDKEKEAAKRVKVNVMAFIVTEIGQRIKTEYKGYLKWNL